MSARAKVVFPTPSTPSNTIRLPARARDRERATIMSSTVLGCLADFPQDIDSLSAGFSTVKSFHFNNLPLTRQISEFIVRANPHIEMKRQRQPSSQIVLFPTGENAGDLLTPGKDRHSIAPADVVLSGSFRKDLPGLSRDFEELKDLGFRILSPTNTTAVSEEDGFVFMQGEETGSPEAIEWRHLDAIRKSSFVWLHAPEGYVGPSAALEVGFARACGIAVYSRATPKEPVLQQMVRTVSAPKDLLATLTRHPEPPLPAVQPFQSYYARAAVQRGYEKESAQNTLLLMLEEFGELARAIRVHQKLRRDKNTAVQEQEELADIFIYVVHMANVLGFDLANAVQRKEQLNIDKFLER